MQKDYFDQVISRLDIVSAKLDKKQTQVTPILFVASGGIMLALVLLLVFTFI